MSARNLVSQDLENLARQAQFRPSVMASLCPISLRHLERLFNESFNQTPTEWLRELKCRIALEMIRQGSPNKAIVADLNFADESHFCRGFKKVYGVSPQTFAPTRAGKHVAFVPYKSLPCAARSSKIQPDA